MAKKENFSYTFLDLAVDVLKESDKPLTADEIWKRAEEEGLTEKINSKGKTPIKSLASKIYVDIRDNKNSEIKQFSKRPAKFWIENKKFDISKQEDGEKSCSEENKKSSYTEGDLHVLLSSFVANNSEFACRTKTIHHEKSPRATKGFNEWLHPDIVGIHFPDEDYSREVVDLQKQLGCINHKIYSFEMKKKIDGSNLRQCYFQAISNSSWANEGYLVAIDICEDENFLSELRRLNNAFGIGIIRLNAENIAQSEVLFPSKTSENLDWDTIEKLSENPDFEDFLKEITSKTHSNKQHHVFDKTFDSEEECREYAREKGII